MEEKTNPTAQHELRPVNTGDFSDYKNTESHIEEVTIARLTDEDLYNLSVESLRFKSWTGFRISLIMFVQGCNQAGYGIDWAVISGINAFDPWHAYFNVASSGVTYGTLNALMTIGTVCGAPFMGLADVIGRRGINFAGNFIVLFASLLQAFAINMPMFMAGRFFLGFGSALMSSSQYMGEVAPLHLRGRLVGIFGACFQVGSLGMNGALIGLGYITTNWCWRIPLLLEGLFPFIVCSTIFFLTPESPRYYIMRGQKEKAKRVVARYQTTEGDNLEHPLVQAVIQQMEESLENDKLGHRQYWDYAVFFKRKALYRLMVLILYSIFQQWNGGGIIGQYLTPALATIGVTKTLDILGINFGLTATYFIFTLVGSYVIDKFKRRTLIFSGLISFIILQTAATITSWQYTLHGSAATAGLTIFWMYAFQTCSSILVATMHNLYPVEILSLALRAKGMGLYSFIQGASGTVNNYGISVGINKIGYKIWCVYIVYNTIQLVLSYFVFPETFGLSLEEIDTIFETPGVRPVKMSLDIQKAKKEKARLEAEALALGAQHSEL
ncbi:MFS sugar transporter-like protein [Coleophoma cylindrospora]|uniref:MFS sugar transporter-like protein n=1 Tax=Coleophoma cylindrospora TaxID=1849047 RepID=A0A3D8SNY9_9HELO|nr:MFS sugar transporter-like protein [Coleophoma cylindrospora]